ncbi:MAG: helix-turn-helix domain-containing protein [Parvibaculum sp.]|nr:helix-turn-helix domain-containing protein [Parvibaculum sp.]
MKPTARMLTIGALAKAAGVSAPTIRYYEEVGLLPKATRSAAGQRLYDNTDVDRLTFIRRSRDFGFSVDQVQQLVDLSISADRDCFEVRDMAAAHLDEVRARLKELRALERNLTGFVKQCASVCAGGSGRDCVVFKDMSKPGTDIRR